jgi:hypothetical protein
MKNSWRPRRRRRAVCPRTPRGSGLRGRRSLRVRSAGRDTEPKETSCMQFTMAPSLTLSVALTTTAAAVAPTAMTTVKMTSAHVIFRHWRAPRARSSHRAVLSPAARFGGVLLARTRVTMTRTKSATGMVLCVARSGRSYSPAVSSTTSRRIGFRLARAADGSGRHHPIGLGPPLKLSLARADIEI